MWSVRKHTVDGFAERERERLREYDRTVRADRWQSDDKYRAYLTAYKATPKERRKAKLRQRKIRRGLQGS